MKRRRRRRRRNQGFCSWRRRFVGWESPSEYYITGSTDNPKPSLVCDIEYCSRDLPFGMGVFRSPAEGEESTIYLLCGEITGKNPVDLDGPIPYEPDMMSTAIYEFDPCSGGRLATPRPVFLMKKEEKDKEKKKLIACIAEPTLAELIAPKASPIVETLAEGKTYVLGLGGSRMFLIINPFSSTPQLCFDGAQGEWIEDIDVRGIYESFSSTQCSISGGRSVSLPGINHADVVGQEGYHFFLFHFTSDDGIHYFASIVRESGVLVCFQEITEEIFEHSKFPLRLQYRQCFSLDDGGGRFYAVLTGVDCYLPPDDDSYNIICVSEFTLTKLNDADRIVSEDLHAGSPPMMSDFVNISSVKNYICSPSDFRMGGDIYGVFIL